MPLALPVVTRPVRQQDAAGVAVLACQLVPAPRCLPQGLSECSHLRVEGDVAQRQATGAAAPTVRHALHLDEVGLAWSPVADPSAL